MEDLADDVVERILAFADHRTVTRFCSTCKRFAALRERDAIWRAIASRRWVLLESLTFG